MEGWPGRVRCARQDAPWRATCAVYQTADAAGRPSLDPAAEVCEPRVEGLHLRRPSRLIGPHSLSPLSFPLENRTFEPLAEGPDDGGAGVRGSPGTLGHYVGQWRHSRLAARRSGACAVPRVQVPSGRLGPSNCQLGSALVEAPPGSAGPSPPLRRQKVCHPRLLWPQRSLAACSAHSDARARCASRSQAQESRQLR